MVSKPRAHSLKAVFGDCVMLAGRKELGRVGPRWIFTARGRSIDPQQDSSSSLIDKSWEVIRPSKPGYLLTDDYFPVELDWACIAVAWRSRSAANQ